MRAISKAYKPEIDGLRAIAVSVVVLFHAGITSLSGGYVGVDIFFVISGYLITGIILRELEQEKFSFRAFYVRRIRRIAPAMFVCIWCTLLAFAFYYPNSFYQELARSFSVQSVFSANIFFWLQSCYFAAAAETKPLLHTWSLAVEEQYYLLFPLFMYIVYRLKPKLLGTTVIIIVLFSLFLSIYGAKHHTYAAFFLLPSRAWELGFGSLIALYASKMDITDKTGNVLTSIGLALIIYAIIAFDKATPFPSFYALFPVLGAALIIIGIRANNTAVGRLLSYKWVTFIGVISYSLYLWHWPIITLLKWVLGENALLFIPISLSFSLLLAYLSYRFIETPVRKNNRVFNDKLIIRGFIALSVSTAALGLLLSATGNKKIVDPSGHIEQFYANALSPEENRKICDVKFNESNYKLVCEYKNTAEQESFPIFVWGDSHASALMPAFKGASEKEGFNMRFSTKSGCQPVLNMRRVDMFQSCVRFNQEVLEHVQKNQYEIVVLVGSFVNNVQQGKIRDKSAPLVRDSDSALAEFEVNFSNMVKRIQGTGAKVLVYTEIPKLEVNPVFENLRKLTLDGEVINSFTTIDKHKARIQEIYQTIDNSGIDGRLNYSHLICDAERCLANIDGKSLYKDKGHISNFGATMLSEPIGLDLMEYLKNESE